ncbi:UNVERIFIED_CONTAM: hypothetical protein Sangu_0798100 [Sesamum angustifolium]|uniref:Dilute domain-containing protein n=1 Tax=Sesamum angustifolium TaxID=2727405 RepID=A0AAW2PVJ2_9LAMI
MKDTDRRRGPNNKEKNRPVRPDTKDRKLQEKNGGKNLKAKEIDAKPSSDKLSTNPVVSDLKTGAAEPSEVYENMVIDYVDDGYRSEEAFHSTKTLKTDEKQGNEKSNDNSSDMEIGDESDAETTNDSVSSHGGSQTADEEKTEKVSRVTKKHSKNHPSDGYSHASRSKSERKANNLQIKAPKDTPKKGAKPEKGLSKSTAKSSSDNLRNMKVHPKPISDSSEGADSQPLEQDKGVDILDEASNGARCVCSEDEEVNTEDNNKQGDKAATDQKIEELETRLRNLESELREVAALEIALYSVAPEHGCSAHKVHTPARRLSRLYIYACKHWSQDKRATVAKNTVSGLVLVSKSCGSDVSRLTFWLSNTVVLREIITQAFGSSCNTNALAKFIDDWQETRTFTAALEKVEAWIFSRIVESVWWQTLTPNMQSPNADSTTNKGAERLLGPALGDHRQGNFSINLWKNAFHDAFKRLCPVRAGGMNVVACLSWQGRCVTIVPLFSFSSFLYVMEQCIGRLDVAMFNAILRESAHEIPTDPVSDPIVDSKVLPIPAGDLSFGSGAQLKNSVGNWARWLSDFLGMDADASAEDEKKSQDDDDKRSTEEPKSFLYLMP